MSILDLPQGWHNPPVEFSLAPFWFWNDRLEDNELLRQLDEMQAHGVDAFVIHPRIGLPVDLGWMSRNLLDKMRLVIEEAERRGMWLILYDEGMYPSGSSSGQVVAENPAYQCRGLVRISLDGISPNSIEQGIRIDANGKLVLQDYQSLIAEVRYKEQDYAIIQRPVNAVIRGLHFLNEDLPEAHEDEPLAIDLLNPDAVACFVRLVYQRYYEEFGAHFGKTIQAIFTDEPHLLGRLQEENIIAGTSDNLPYVNEFLGYDFTPYLAALWDADAPQWIRDDYERALESRLEKTYYAQLYNFCEAHGIALTGHPAEADALRHLKYFHIAGQDIVWRHIEPNKASALEGRQSTQAKAAASVMLHRNRRRNANEFCGAYGHELSFGEMTWLAHWLLIRGCNLLIPHAFYYSVRGARYNERPPDVGLHSAWWGDNFTEFANTCRRLAWLNTDSEQVCHVAILGEHHHLTWRAAKACFENQIDFNYLDIEDLVECQIHENQLALGRQRYQVLIVDSELKPEIANYLTKIALATAGDGLRPSPTLDGLSRVPNQLRIIYWSDDSEACISQLKSFLPASPFDKLALKALRLRHLRKDGIEWLMLFNEEKQPLQFHIDLAHCTLLNPYTGECAEFHGQVALNGYELLVLVRKAA